MKNIQSKSGSALIMVMGVIVLSSMISGAIMLASNNHYRLASKQVDMERALYIAEAGLEVAADYLSSQQGFVGATYSRSGTIDGHTYAYTMDKIGWRTYTMSSEGTVRGISRTITIDRVYLPTYAKYALWMDENGEIYFIPGETFDGHVHSNERVWFSGSQSLGGPEFWKEVTSGASSFGGSPQYATFHEGYELDASEGQMSTIDFDGGSVASLRNLSDSFGVRFSGDVDIYLDGDTFWTRTGSSWTQRSVQEDQLVYVDGTTTMYGGELDGRMTIVSENDIWIRDHIRYTDDPRDDDPLTGVVSDDSLGLISKDDVWISTSAPDDLEIFAAILAAGVRNSGNDGSFGVSQYNDSRYGLRGDLTVYGSIVQDVRGAVGTFRHGVGSLTGYTKDYYFDPRFEDEPPPYYPPVSDEIIFDGWEEDAS